MNPNAWDIKTRTMNQNSAFDHELDIKCSNGLNVTENKLFESMKKIGLNPEIQYKIGLMTVDFAFPDKKIVIEVNGPYHNSETQRYHDKSRWVVLKRYGWTMRSFTSNSVYYHSDAIAERIAEFIGAHIKKIIQI